MPETYLTIDDSPSPHTHLLTDFLAKHDMPALFFCRGDMLDAYFDQAVDAIDKGFVLANHAYSHTRFSTLSYDEGVEEIEKTQTLIERAYSKAGKVQNTKAFRFPHMDRGTGGWIVDYDALKNQHKDFIKALFADGLNITLDPPSDEQITKKKRIQTYLQKEGYAQPFPKVTYDWFKDSELEHATDCMYTFSSSDWMLLDRHIGKWKYKSLDDLKSKIDDDPYVMDKNSASILLFHDKPEPELLPVVTNLLLHMKEKNFTFLPFK